MQNEQKMKSDSQQLMSCTAIECPCE